MTTSQRLISQSSVVVVFLAVLLCLTSITLAAPPYPIILVHGINSSSNDCWDKEGKTSLCDAFRDDWGLQVAPSDFHFNLNYVDSTSIDGDIYCFQETSIAANIYRVDFKITRTGDSGDDFGPDHVSQSDSNEAAILQG